MRIFLATFVWSLVLGQTVSAADADGPRMEEVLTLMQARNLIAGCEAYAEDNKLAPLSMAVYDASGNLKHFSRQDGAILVTVEFAHVKGRTAAVVGMATSELGAIEFANNERPLGIRYFDNLTVVQGGVAVLSNSGEHIGGFGVSGAPSEQDEACGLAGIIRMLERTKQVLGGDE
jgi:uncharacterized protein GlcG (DUF336 family)